MSKMLDKKEQKAVYVDFLRRVESEGKSVIIEADLSSSIGTHALIPEYKERYVNVGIMEQEMIGLASGLSILGYKPFIHTFAPFASRRVFDQVFLALNYNDTNAVLVGSDAGIHATANGGTHMGLEDIALMRTIPHATVYEPSDNTVFNAILEEACAHEGFSYIRTIRKVPDKIHEVVDVKKGYSVVSEGEDVLIIATGIMVSEALKAKEILESEGISATVIDLFRIKPLNHDILNEFKNHKVIVTAENHNVIGGTASAISDLFSEYKPALIKRVGVKESFGEVGSVEYLQERFKLTADEIVVQAKTAL